MNIIGIAGTNGSGKDSVSQILAELGWCFVSVSSDIIIPELIRRGLPLERANMAAITEEWRKRSGPGVIIDKALELYKNARHEHVGLVVSSIRHPGEAARIHELGGKLVWIDADPHVRYQRIYSRGQGDKDNKSFDQFQAEEEREMTNTNQMYNNMAPVKDAADFVIENSGDDIESLRQEVRNKING